jgi:phosphomannomutase
MKKSIYIFDIDGTIADSGKHVDTQILDMLSELKTTTDCELALCGGGSFEKINTQVLEAKFIDHIFAECGCDYRKYNIDTNHFTLVQERNIRLHANYKQINMLIRNCLRFIAGLNYNLGGHMIDIRKGLVYVSLVGMTATEEERNAFIALDKIHHYRLQLIQELKDMLHVLQCENQIQVMIGGAVGVTIMPIEHDKIQILNHLDENVYNTIYYFGDKYDEGGNDYKIMQDPRVKASKVNSPSDTKNILSTMLLL